MSRKATGTASDFKKPGSPLSTTELVLRLADLDLTSAKLPPAGLREMLAGCARLTKLNLSWTQFGACDGGFGADPRPLSNFPSL